MSTTQPLAVKPQSSVTGNILSSDTYGAEQTVNAPFGEALIRAGEANPRIVGLTADLGKYTDIHLFANRFPERFFQIGMAEQNLIGVAAGLARTGFIPFATTYCVFATRRAYDFIAIGAALGSANVKIIAGLPGLTTGYGGTHQGIEDLALMRSIPNLTVIDPCDATELSQVIPAIAEHPGPAYVRLLRGQVPVTLDPATYRFELGKAKLLCEGTEVAIISTGLMTARAIKAVVELREQGISAALLHISTLKPFDKDAVLALLRRIPRVVTAENHFVTGGLASAVADTVVDAGIAVKIRRIGIPDCFCESGTIPYLVQRYQMDTCNIVSAASEMVDKTG